MEARKGEDPPRRGFRGADSPARSATPKQTIRGGSLRVDIGEGRSHQVDVEDQGFRTDNWPL
jgi:hypothetical protein